MPFLTDREALSVDDRLAAQRPARIRRSFVYRRRSAEVHRRLPRVPRLRLSIASPSRGAGNLLTIRLGTSADAFRVWWRAGSVKPKRSVVEPVRTRRFRSVFLIVIKLNIYHVMPGGLQGRAIESRSITVAEH